MTDAVPAAAITAAALAVHKMACPGDGIDGCLADNTCEEKPFGWEIDAARAALEAAAPHIAAAAVEDYRKDLADLFKAIIERRSDAEFEERLQVIRARHLKMPLP